MFKSFLIFVFILFCSNVHLQELNNEILKVEKIAGGDAFHFPIISSEDKLIEDKINVHLQLAELDLIRKENTQNIFEKVTKENETIYGSKVAIDYAILANTENVFSLKFNQSSCGATCAYWVCYYNFNPKNGDRYALKDFFNKANYQVFRDTVLALRKEKILKQINIVSKSGSNVEHVENYLLELLETDELYEFYFTPDSIYFDSENLLHKGDKLLNLDHITAVSIDQIEHLLNDFGEAALCTGKDLETFRSMTEPQLYEGVIAEKYNIYLLFRNSYGNVFQGSYAYKNYGRAISLYGETKNNEYIFDEFDDEWNKLAVLSFRKEEDTLHGFWKDKKGNTLKLEAYRK